MDITSIILLIFIVMVVINTIYSTKYGVVNMPSSRKTRSIIIDDIQSLSTNGNGLTIYDCGSGWGGLCARLHRAFPKATITGFEISPIPYLISKLNPFRRYKIQRDNLFDIDLEQDDILIFYLSPRHMIRIKNEIIPKLKKGTLIYSQGFPIPDMKPQKTFMTTIALEKECYRYSV